MLRASILLIIDFVSILISPIIVKANVYTPISIYYDKIIVGPEEKEEMWNVIDVYYYRIILNITGNIYYDKIIVGSKVFYSV